MILDHRSPKTIKQSHIIQNLQNKAGFVGTGVNDQIRSQDSYISLELEDEGEKYSESRYQIYYDPIQEYIIIIFLEFLVNIPFFRKRNI